MFHFFSVSRKGTAVLQQWEEQEVESLPSILLQYVAKGEVGLVEGSAVTSGPTKCLRKPAARSAAGAEEREPVCLQIHKHLSFKEEMCEHGFSRKNSYVSVGALQECSQIWFYRVSLRTLSFLGVSANAGAFLSHRPFFFFHLSLQCVLTCFVLGSSDLLWWQLLFVRFWFGAKVKIRPFVCLQHYRSFSLSLFEGF